AHRIGVDRRPDVVRVVKVGGVEVAVDEGTSAFRVNLASDGAGDHGGVVGALNGDGDHLRRAIGGGGQEGIGQRAAGVQRLHRRIGVVERVAPHTGSRERIGAVAIGTGRWGAHDGPGVVRIVHVGGIEVAGRGGNAGRAVGDAAS